MSGHRHGIGRAHQAHRSLHDPESLACVLGLLGRSDNMVGVGLERRKKVAMGERNAPGEGAVRRVRMIGT